MTGDPVYTSDELALEREMSRLGEERYAAVSLQARSHDQFTVTAPGRAVLRRFLEPYEERVRGWVASKARRGRKGAIADADLVPVLQAVTPPVAALIGACSIIDRLHREQPAASLGFTVGRAVEDEWRMREVRRAAPEVVREIKRKTRGSGPDSRRRSALERASRHGVLPRHLPHTTRLRLGLLLVELFNETTGLLEFQNVRLGRKERVMVMASRGAEEWIERAEDRAMRSAAVYLPTVDPPVDWEGVDGGGYLTDLVLRRPIARFRGDAHEGLVRSRDPKRDFPGVLSALNRLQRTPYRINEDVLVALEHVVEAGGTPLEDLSDEPLPVQPVAEKGDDLWLDWRREAGRARRRNKVRRSRRILVHQTTGLARRLLDLGRPFYYPHRLDFRGRAYPVPYWVQPQGPDVGRSLIQFAEGAPLDGPGWRALLVYGANLFGVRGTLEERQAWAVDHLQAVEAVYGDPIDCRWWHKADEPFQFLAWCLEVGAALESGFPQRGGFVTHLPVHIDASNNGLQLFALMTGDEYLARQTNVVHSPGGPRDIYSEVSRQAFAWLREGAEGGDPIARSLVDFLGPDGIPRSCAKRPVMTLPYDVTLWSAQNYVYEWYKASVPRGEEPLAPDSGKKCRHLAGLLLDATTEVCKGAVEAMSWLHALAGEAAKQGVPLRWTAPSGWPVQQEYRRSDRKRVRTILGGAVRQINLVMGRGPVDPAQQRQGVAPNFVHSVDAAVMSAAVSSWPRGRPIAAIHDSFATTAPHVGDLRDTLRGAVVEEVLKKSLLSAFWEEARSYIQGAGAVGPPPTFGEIDPEAVLKSPYLFS